MALKRFTGPQAGSQKYDLLTALCIAGLNGSPGFRTAMLRLVALVTARYNWRTDELTVGQRDMARLWSVDERTVKREIRRLTEAGILLRLRPGVRGRVGAYRLNLAEIHRLSAPHWGRVGADFEARMQAEGPAPGTRSADGQPADLRKVVRVDFAARGHAPAGQGADPAWARVLDRLAQSDPGLFSSWFAGLELVEHAADCLRLRAPSAFAASYVTTHHLRPLHGMAMQEFPGLRRIEIIA